MNGRTARLIKKVAKARGIRHRRYISSLKRHWYSLNWKERTEQRKEWKEEVKNTNSKSLQE